MTTLKKTKNLKDL